MRKGVCPGPAERVTLQPSWWHGSLTDRIEDSFTGQLDALPADTRPADTRQLVQLAAADPSGDRSLVWRAAGRLGISAPAAAVPAAEAGLVEFGAQVQFRHPLARSAAYWSASLSDRQRMHEALAEVTDPVSDPDRRAWHRAQAAAGPDEEVAAELERCAGRAQARGGLAAAADADKLYREAIDRLSRTLLRPELARAHLLYGSGCAAKAGAPTRASSCAPPATCSPRSAWKRSPSAPAANCSPPARPSASATRKAPPR